MQLSIKGPNRELTGAIRVFVQDRVIGKLSRVSENVQSIAIVVRDVNGPRGGVDHLLRIVVRLKSGGSIVVRHRSADAYVDLPVAIKRAAGAVMRELGRRRTTRRAAYRRNLIA